MSEIVVLSGSPSESSRSDLVLKYMGSLLLEKGLSVRHISVRDVPQEALFYGKYDSTEIKEIASVIENAKGVIVGSPVYKATYSGVLKALIDLLPQDVLQDKPVLPLMIGGSMSHLLAIEYTLKPLLASLKGQNLKGVYLVDTQIDKQQISNPVMDQVILERLNKQLYYFVDIVNRQKAVVL
ncbi:NADPH-dependent FMN reductase [Radiobacillus kanasensis]|uniref:NADPH-dependent FMN reductase n=1 Tax=Radiobacillus kanasensis TaxID=2844358 RepID=UPI001E58D26F|nr:NADPH-dependent FMN reductase [Radiobacillus kanasensis]UFU00194.1 NADPH-dependent FMN reductase [Radiobacillus kanasensis]